MVLNRSRFAGALTAYRLLESPKDEQELRDLLFNLDTPVGIQGPPVTGYYQSTRNRLNNRRRVKIDHNCFLILNDNDSLVLRFHATDILTIEPDNSVTIDFGEGDYKTVSTISRMNQILPDGFSISRRYKREPGAYREWGTSGEYYAPATSEVAYWNVSGMQVNPSMLMQIEANTGDVIKPDGMLVTTAAPTWKKIRKPRSSRGTDPDIPPVD